MLCSRASSVLFVRQLWRPARMIDHEAQRGEVAAFDREAPVEHRAAGRVFQHRQHARADIGADQVAREPHEGEQVPLERRLHQREARARAVGQRHHRGHDPFERLVGEADREVVRQRGEARAGAPCRRGRAD